MAGIVVGMLFNFPWRAGVGILSAVVRDYILL